jgi:hypothetical protein
VAAALGDAHAATNAGEEALRLARSVGSQTLLLGVLSARGQLLAYLGQHEAAAKVLSLVVAHPATICYERKLAKDTLAVTARQLSQHQLEAAANYGRPGSLEGIVEEVLDRGITSL